MAVDWGAKRIGLAISDETRSLARPLMVISHTSRKEDARRIVETAVAAGVDTIIMGVTYEEGSCLSPSGRSAQRLGEEIKSQSSLRVILRDEDFTTKKAKELSILTGQARGKRRGHSDDKAAALFLQEYLEACRDES